MKFAQIAVIAAVLATSNVDAHRLSALDMNKADQKAQVEELIRNMEMFEHQIEDNREWWRRILYGARGLMSHFGVWRAGSGLNEVTQSPFICLR